MDGNELLLPEHYYQLITNGLKIVSEYQIFLQVRFLLDAGADQEHKTDEMHTALMEASMDGHVEVARLLLDSGAQVNMPADSFESPLTLAACGGRIDLVYCCAQYY